MSSWVKNWGSRRTLRLVTESSDRPRSPRADWVNERKVTLVGMEATSLCWKPIHWILEGSVPEVWVIKSRHMRNVPGRKTDVNDAIWGASLIEHGLVRPGFIPPEPFRALRDLLDPYAAAVTIPGVSHRTAQVIPAEIGADMSRFPTAEHLGSWAGMCPGNNESAGKHCSGRTCKGSKWLRKALIEAGQAAGRTKDTYFAAQYAQIRGRRGPQRAAIAVGHSILVICWHVLTNGEPYNDLGGDYFHAPRSGAWIG